MEADSDTECHSHELSSAVTVDSAAVQAAVGKLAAGDAYRKKLTTWSAKLAALPVEDRPPKPPALDDRKGSNVLRVLRQEVHSTATTHWNQLHAAWLVKNDARKKQLRAERDAQRDWKYIQRDRTEAAQKRRAARAWLVDARQKPLLHLTSAELDQLFETSRHFTLRETDKHDVLDGLWELLRVERLPLSWVAGNWVEADPETGQACVFIGNFRADGNIYEQRWHGAMVTQWHNDSMLHVDIERGDFAERNMLERGTCYSWYTMTPTKYIRKVGDDATFYASEPEWLFQKRLLGPQQHAQIKQVRRDHKSGPCAVPSQ